MESYNEEEQVEAIKRFWKDNGTAIILGAVIGLGGLWGWRYYNQQQIATAEKASTSYENVVSQLAGKDGGMKAAETFVKANPDNSYAMLAALQVAKKATDSKDYAEASKQLEWAAAHSTNPAITGIIKLRLARLQIAEKQPEQAITTLAKVDSSAYQAAVLEVKGDALAAQNKDDQARVAYQASMQKNPNNPLLQMKLDNLAAASK